jgi:hypothetical protein
MFKTAQALVTPPLLGPALAVLLLPLQAQSQPVVAIRARAMVDVDGSRLIEKATIVIGGDRIIAAGATADVRVPADASRIDLPATTLVPGLIDAHVHLTLGGDAAANAQATLAAGFTTVQDLGAAAYANVVLVTRSGRDAPRGRASSRQARGLGCRAAPAISTASGCGGLTRSARGCAKT